MPEAQEMGAVQCLLYLDGKLSVNPQHLHKSQACVYSQHLGEGRDRWVPRHIDQLAK